MMSTWRRATRSNVLRLIRHESAAALGLISRVRSRFRASVAFTDTLAESLTPAAWLRLTPPEETSSTA
jgi:hypothetical protein